MDSTTYVRDLLINISQNESTLDIVFNSYFYKFIMKKLKENLITTLLNVSRKNEKWAFLLINMETSLFLVPLKSTLIEKFLYKHPNMDVLRKHFDDLKLIGKWMIYCHQIKQRRGLHKDLLKKMYYIKNAK